ncbi:MAG: pyrroline-5-carboxylate reductase [Verrucomicrobiales bacterium]
MRIGFIGAGKMASAIIRGLKNGPHGDSCVITVTDRDDAALDLLMSQVELTRADSAAEVVSRADVLLLAVKPGDVATALSQMGALGAEKLLISVAAGITLETLEILAPEARIVRVMPNTPALVHRGAAAYALGQRATEDDGDVVNTIFCSVGSAQRVEEKYLDAVTGLSGSGPAFVCLVIEALADGGVREGLPRAMALQLAAQTVAGTAELVLQTGEHPAVLRESVSSPSGTTIAGLDQLEQHAVRHAFSEAVRVASERSRELSHALSSGSSRPGQSS